MSQLWLIIPLLAALPLLVSGVFLSLLASGTRAAPRRFAAIRVKDRSR